MPLVGGAAVTLADPSVSEPSQTGTHSSLADSAPPPDSVGRDALDEPSGISAGPEAPTDELDRSALSRALRRSEAIVNGPAGPPRPGLSIPSPSTVLAPNELLTPPGAPPAIRYPVLVVVRGERIDVEYRIVDGRNYIGRSTDRGVDIDLTGQEAVEQTWTSRQHAVLTLDRGTMTLEDLNSLNGTFVNRSRVHPGQQRVLHHGDVIQVGTVQLRVVF